jgi:polar amino acid transport system substrate-binding protein
MRAGPTYTWLMKSSFLWFWHMLIRRCRVVGLSLFFLVQVAQAETIVLGAEDSWYPYSGLVNNEAQGFTVDLVRAAFAAVGVQANFLPLPYARCTKEVKSGTLLGCFDTSRSAIVEPDFLWHQKPMFYASVKIYARSPTKVSGTTVQDLVGKRVAVTNGYEYGNAFDSNTAIFRDNSPNDLSALRKLAMGRVDYALVFSRVATMLIKKNADELMGKIAVVGELERLPLYTIFSKTYPNSARYVELFERGFDAITKNGRLKEIEKQWE